MNKKTANRVWSLMPKGIPRYIRVYDNCCLGSDERYVVIYSGKYRSIPNRQCCTKTGPTGFLWIYMSENPFDSKGTFERSESKRQVDVNKAGFAPAIGRKNYLGTRIPFSELPKDCQKIVLHEYREIWNLPASIFTLVEKLNPKGFRLMTPKMGSIVAYILGQEWVTPQVNSLVVTGDGFVLAQVKGNSGYNHFLGSENDLARNWDELLHVADLAPDEYTLAEKLFSEKVMRQ